MSTLEILGVPIVPGIKVEGDARGKPFFRRVGTVLEVVKPKGRWVPIIRRFSGSDWIIRVDFGAEGSEIIYDCGPMDVIPA